MQTLPARQTLDSYARLIWVSTPSRKSDRLSIVQNNDDKTTLRLNAGSSATVAFNASCTPVSGGEAVAPPSSPCLRLPHRHSVYGRRVIERRPRQRLRQCFKCFVYGDQHLRLTLLTPIQRDHLGAGLDLVDVRRQLSKLRQQALIDAFFTPLIDPHSRRRLPIAPHIRLSAATRTMKLCA